MKIDIQRDHARTLRKHMTVVEPKLWAAIRGRALSSYRFNRQVEIGPYIADFLCRESRVIVEVDAVTHGDTHEVKYDTRRTAISKQKAT